MARYDRNARSNRVASNVWTEPPAPCNPASVSNSVSKPPLACHVAEINRKYKGRIYRTYLLRRTYREGDKVKHQTLGNLTHLPPQTIELIRRSLRGDTMVAADEVFEIIRSRPHGHVAAVLGTARRLGLPQLIASGRSRERDLVEAMIAARIIEPSSKLAIARALHSETKESSLPEVLGVESASEDELYAAMDWLLPRQRRIEEALAKRHLGDGTLALYDLTSTYFEGRKCPLAKLGHSRDGKAGKLQIVFGLLTNAEGCPVAVEVFAGNTGDPKTVASQVEKLRERFKLNRVVLVGDRGMLTSARIRDDLKTADGLAWITALRAPAIQALVNATSLQLSLFDEKDLVEITSLDYPAERLIACRNPFLLEERARKREDLLAATERGLAKIAAATMRVKRPLRGEEAIALRVGQVIGRFKMKKHFRISIEKDAFHYERDQESIAREAALDGVYVIRSSVPANDLSAQDTVRWYKRLSVVERAFRSIKSVDLHVRPIGHRKEERVRAHVFLCMLAYYVEWQMRRDLAPILFDDHDKEAGEAQRDSVVAPAQRSPAAESKARTKRTDDDEPVHSFQSLLRDLRTIVKNRVRLTTAAAAEFDRITTPTPVQRRALDLLKASLSM
jgi:Transposase DDE domain